MLKTLENPCPGVKREVIRLLVDRIIVEDDTIVIHHIVSVTDNGRLSLMQVRFENWGKLDDLDHEIDIQESIRGWSIYSTIQIKKGPMVTHVTTEQKVRSKSQSFV